ncbi:MAG TPA: CDP-alcohol phosphatidyltransferase family protein [Polyangia bacterium]|nr:CDP-alcohol phosphatidyltransferase family protein [Polyangia bacterium]
MMSTDGGDGGGAARASVPRRLAAEIAAVAAGGLAILIVAAPALAPDHGPAFLAGSAGPWTWFMATLWRRRADNRPAPAPPVPAAAAVAASLGAPTLVTLARALLVSALGGLLAAGGGSEQLATWWPGALYAAAVVGDLADGALARRLARTTKLGASLDVTTDAAGLLVAPLLAVARGRLPPWYLLLSVAYPLFRSGLWLRARLGLPVPLQRLRPYPAARFAAGAQMALVTAALFPFLPRPLLWPAATVIMLPTLALFAREWRLVTSPSAPIAEAPAQPQHAGSRVGPGAEGREAPQRRQPGRR